MHHMFHLSEQTPPMLVPKIRHNTALDLLQLWHWDEFTISSFIPCTLCNILMNVTMLISTQRCVHFWPRFCIKSALQHIPMLLGGVQVWTYLWKWCLVLSEPFFNNLSLMNQCSVLANWPNFLETLGYWC